jgi:hypothetical protein
MLGIRNPDPHPNTDPYVFGPPGSASESVSHKYGSGSGSIHQAKLFILKNDAMFQYSGSGSGSVILMFLGLPDTHPELSVRGTDPRMDPHPDPYQKVTDPQHWLKSQMPVLLFFSV